MAPVNESQSTSLESGSEQTVIEDSLVEEVSIDGMCGVY